MYQNSTIIPLKNTNGQVDHICLIIYDVTETAVNKLQLESANLELQRIGETDGLTGLLNRKTWEAKLNEQFKLFARYGTECSLIMFDIDHFKRINDGFGHPAGDEAIRQAASISTSCIREVDVAGRYGGEEFAILLLNTSPNGAKVVAERIRESIEANSITYDDKVIEYTVSLGIAGVDSSMAEPTQWIEAADKCLYQAKEAGRNNSVLRESA
jgi:diguanylate cyclase (GGDEF)-like protein